ncbi:MAG: hypothetical protein MJA28_15255 [Gammaproteobacteria bacterium]|nr:hypothetical protein [Gammaproteobacteria bacterium]
MKKALNIFSIGLLIGGLCGLWFGVNIGKGHTFYANPFAGSNLTQVQPKSD